MSQACDDHADGSSGVDGEADGSQQSNFAARALRSQQLRKSRSDVSHLLSPPGGGRDWRTVSMFLFALLKVEAWLHARVLESVWWQVLNFNARKHGRGEFPLIVQQFIVIVLLGFGGRYSISMSVNLDEENSLLIVLFWFGLNLQFWKCRQ